MRGGAPAEVNRRSAQPRPTGGQLPFLGQVGIGGVRGSEGVALLVRGARAAAARPAKCRITERMTRPPTERDLLKTPSRLISRDEVCGPGTRLSRFRNAPDLWATIGLFPRRSTSPSFRAQDLSVALSML